MKPFLPLFIYTLQVVSAATVCGHSHFTMKGTLHRSRYSETETNCAGKPCTVLDCAVICATKERCAVFSHNPNQGACILSQRPDYDPGDYNTASPDWNTYFRKCPVHKGYKQYDSHQPPLCFRVPTVRGNEAEARAVCQRDGGDLARIKTEQVSDFVMGVIAESGTSKNWYVGAGDKETEQEIYWNDGTRLYYHSPMWQDSKEGRSENEDCIALTPQGRLLDLPCSFIEYFVCQYDI